MNLIFFFINFGLEFMVSESWVWSCFVWLEVGVGKISDPTRSDPKISGSDWIGLLIKPDRMNLCQLDRIVIGSDETRSDPKTRLS